MPSRSLLCLSILLPFVAGYADTIPVVAWSSHKSPALDSIASSLRPYSKPSEFFDAILNKASICDYDAIIIADQPGLHASDLRTITPSSYIAQSIKKSKSSLQIPYLPVSEGSDFLEAFKSSVADRCASRRLELELGQGGVPLHKGEKHLVSLSLPSLEDTIGRSKTMSKCHKDLHKDVSNVASVFPSHIVIYTSSRPLAKRQEVLMEEDDMLDDTSPFFVMDNSKSQSASAAVNTTLVKGSLTQRYQFFTPGLITALLVMFGLFIPILMFGINALASIQSPRMDSPKGPSLEKKNQ
ncbi:hypothetical protein M422DRAFT_265820 [Sphaerobolus stellatus SS14]|uniref:Protein BIG1 n=1 Tax=Sphaerobolus stellatus (strain SS14) TaxID=990650 RepID=A0A0C9V4I0_SPHS4|nr:hypothetical protein M422DRAFT_265820 [Sphaerobolus stellatus SS14]